MGLLSRILGRKAEPVSVARHLEAAGSPRRLQGPRYTTHRNALAQRGLVQGNARQAVANNPLLASAVSAWVTAAVGDEVKAISQHPHPDTRSAINAAFARWAKDVTTAGRRPFAAAVADMVRAEMVDGEAFALWQGDKLQLVPAEQVRSDHVRDGVINGIEFAADGAFAAIHVDPDPTRFSDPIRVPADDVLHLFRPAGPGAVRGVSRLAPVLLMAQELDGVTDALTVQTRVAALMSVILTNEGQISGDDPLEDVGALEPGAILRVPGGWRVTTTAPQQSQQVAPFVGHLTHSIAAGLGLPHWLVTGQVGEANYSSLRAALVAFRQEIAAFQYLTLVPQVLEPIWRRIVTRAILSGEIDSDLSDDALSVEWIFARQPWVDPLKDTQAAVLQIENGLMSRRQAVAEMGYDLDALDAEIAADAARSPNKPEVQP